MMIKQDQLPQTKANYKIVCLYCQAIIRDDAFEEGEGMCLACYKQIIAKHLRGNQQSGTALNASDR